MNYYEKIVAEKLNKKNEKENSTVLRGTIHGHKYEVDKMSDGSYMGYVYDEEDFPIFKTSLHSTAAGAEQEIKGKIFNSKAENMNYYAKLVEKKNDAALSRAVNIALTFLKEGADDDRIKKEMERDYNISPEMTKDALIAAKRLLNK